MTDRATLNVQLLNRNKTDVTQNKFQKQHHYITTCEQRTAATVKTTALNV